MIFIKPFIIIFFVLMFSSIIDIISVYFILERDNSKIEKDCNKQSFSIGRSDRI